eukprot:IDg8454t1
MLLSNFVLGERIGGWEILAASMSFFGIVLVANPDLSLDLSGTHSPSYLLGVCLGLLSAMIAACAFVTTRYLGSQVSFMSNVIAFGVTTSIIGTSMGGATFASFRGQPECLALALFGGVAGFFGQCFLNKGFQYCDAGAGSVLRTIDVPLSYVLGLIFLHEVPHSVSLFGSLFVVAGAVTIGSRSFF